MTALAWALVAVGCMAYEIGRAAIGHPMTASENAVNAGLMLIIAVGPSFNSNGIKPDCGCLANVFPDPSKTVSYNRSSPALIRG